MPGIRRVYGQYLEMGKLQTFEILVDNPASGHFRPGDTLSGQVVLELTEDLHIIGMFILF
jgi:hypothetical protein